MHAQKAECCSNTVHFTYILLLLTPIKSAIMPNVYTHIQSCKNHLCTLKVYVPSRIQVDVDLQPVCALFNFNFMHREIKVQSLHQAYNKE